MEHRQQWRRIPPSRLSTLGLIAQTPDDAFGQHVTAHTLKEREVVVAIPGYAGRHSSSPSRPPQPTASRSLRLPAMFAHRPGEPRIDRRRTGDRFSVFGFRQEVMTIRLAHRAVFDALFVGIVRWQKPKRSREYFEATSQVTAGTQPVKRIWVSPASSPFPPTGQSSLGSTPASLSRETAGYGAAELHHCLVRTVAYRIKSE